MLNEMTPDSILRNFGDAGNLMADRREILAAKYGDQLTEVIFMQMTVVNILSQITRAAALKQPIPLGIVEPLGVTFGMLINEVLTGRGHGDKYDLVTNEATELIQGLAALKLLKNVKPEDGVQ